MPVGLSLLSFHTVMELEGFGTSLTGYSLYIPCREHEAWIPWEFLSGHISRVLVTSDTPSIRLVEAENTWNAVFRPTTPKEWSCIATVVRNLVGPTLLVFDGSPSPPDAFLPSIEQCTTKIWIGNHASIPVIPDAIFFPVLRERITEAYNILTQLPGRNSHGAWKGMSASEWSLLITTTTGSELGIVVSDVGESEWVLFWHNPSDSLDVELCKKRGISWLQTGVHMMELC